MSFWVLLGRQPAAAYFLMPCRFWELGAGGLLWLALQRRGVAARLAWLGDQRWAVGSLGLLMAALVLPRGLQGLATAAVVLLSGNARALNGTLAAQPAERPRPSHRRCCAALGARLPGPAGREACSAGALANNATSQVAISLSKLFATSAPPIGALF